jgi:hypothetical protein
MGQARSRLHNWTARRAASACLGFDVSQVQIAALRYGAFLRVTGRADEARQVWSKAQSRDSTHLRCLDHCRGGDACEDAWTPYDGHRGVQNA